MNNEIQIFDNPDLNAHIRVIEIDGEPWFVAKDICQVLGTQTRDIRKILDPEEIRELPSVDIIHTGSTGGSDRVSDRSNGGSAPLIISESGMYIMALRSRKPVAKPFQKWVTKEVLPTIRKTGHYGQAKPELPPMPSYKEALQGWLNEINAHEQTKFERDEAVRTKAWINGRRTASAMGTAGSLSKKCDKLERENAELTKKLAKLESEHKSVMHVHQSYPEAFALLNQINEAIEKAEGNH